MKRAIILYRLDINVGNFEIIEEHRRTLNNKPFKDIIFKKLFFNSIEV